MPSTQRDTQPLNPVYQLISFILLIAAIVIVVSNDVSLTGPFPKNAIHGVALVVLWINIIVGIISTLLGGGALAYILKQRRNK